MSVLYAATTTTTFKGYGFGDEEKKPTSPHRMVISPNLDALLEHEERQRTTSISASSMLMSATEPPTALSPIEPPVSPVTQSLSPSAEFPIGLPPPPRRARGPKSPRSPSGTVRESPSWMDIENQENVRPSTGSSSRSNPYINPAPTLEEMFWSRDTGALLAASQQSACVDNLHSSQISQNAPNPSVLHVRARTTSNLTPEMRQIHREDNEVAEGDGQRPWPRRPLISHGKQSSLSSSESTHSASTHPASSAENEVRISISSTIYPPSAESHTHTLFNEPPIDPITHRDSFMELYSPTNAQFDLQNVSPTSTTPDQISPLQFAQSPPSITTNSSFILEDPPAPTAKPPVPTAPKPIFSRAGLRPKPQVSPPSSDEQQKPKPATTNFLDIEERADLIRKSKKLARVFGQTPDADAMALQDSGRSASNSFLSTRRVRGSAADALRPHTVWRGGLSADTHNISLVRRHSMPLSPDDVSFISLISPIDEPAAQIHIAESRPTPQEGNVASGRPDTHHETSQIRSGSPTSFIDLSEDVPDSASIKASLPISPSQSIFDSMSVDQQEEERRRKRERLAKLHRFLGSRVPAHLVLGIDDSESSLPPAAQRTLSSPVKTSPSSDSDDGLRKAWLKRRRTASVNLLSSNLPDDLERVKEELDDKEKAINVRRAQKMEKVFGVAPPQTLYHTRHSSALPPPAKSAGARNAVPPLMDQTSSLPVALAAKAPRQKKKKDNRPGTSESNKGLLPKNSSSFGFGGFDDRMAMTLGTTSQTAPESRHSFVYNHYQHSLTTLNDIIDRDDKASLAELHQYLNSHDAPDEQQQPIAEEEPTSSVTPTQYTPRADKRSSTGSSIKSERRRSLPARTSMISVSSEYTLSSPRAEVTTFQMRRRRAAKLTQFFGVDYRELINDVLESIESGVQTEEKNGTLRAEEVEELLEKLRNLKTKRQSFQ